MLEDKYKYKKVHWTHAKMDPRQIKLDFGEKEADKRDI